MQRAKILYVALLTDVRHRSQVRFLREAFRKLRCGLPLLALHGGLSQPKRVTVYQEFSRSEHVALFATDIAARGLDFPAVDWVVQVRPSDFARMEYSK